MYIFICQDSLDGILTGVYDAWAYKIETKGKCNHHNLHLLTGEPDNYELFCDYISVTPSFEKSAKVSHTLRTRLGDEFYDTITKAALSLEPSKRRDMDKADAIYQTIVFALSSPAGAHVLNYLSEPYIHRVFELSRGTHREAHHLMGFLRFSELKNGVLFSKIHPKNDVLPILADFFVDRLPTQNFMIYDENRQLAAVHAAGKDYMLVDASDMDQELLTHFSDREDEYQNLWLTFFESIGIKARTNAALQAQNIPKRYWPDAVELRNKL